MKKKLLNIFIILLLSGVIAGCDSCDPPPTSPEIVLPSDSEPVIYSKHIQPIFTKNCAGAGCHIGGNKFSGLALDSWSDVMAGSKYGSMVVPYSGNKSHLVYQINYDSTLAPFTQPRMPYGRDSMPIAYVKAIKRWIDEGAKNDDGSVYLSQARPRIFVTAQSEDKVTVIDLEKEQVVRYVSVGSRPEGSPEAPHNILLSPDKKYFYVNLIAAGMIEKYSTETFLKIAEARVGLSPAQIVCTKDGKNLFVSNFDLNQNFIVQVDAETMKPIRNIENVGRGSHSLALSDDETILYSANAYGDEIVAIDLSTFEVTKRLPIIPNSPLAPTALAVVEPYNLILDKTNNKLYVSCRKKAQIRIIDIAEWKVTDSIQVGARPLITGLLGQELWAPNQAENTVSVINLQTKQVQTISGFLTQPHAVAFSQDGKRAFISCENQKDPNLHHPLSGGSTTPARLYVVDITTKQITKNIEVGSFAAGIAISD